MTEAFRVPVIMALSMVAVVYGLLERDMGSPDVVASVNGESLTAKTVLDTVGAPPATITEAWVDAALESAIIDALYFQRARELHLAERDPVLRGRVMQILREVAEEEAALQPVTDAELRALYDEDAARFSTSAVVRFREIYVQEQGSTVPDRLLEARARVVAGEDFETVRRELGDPPPFAFPDDLVPLHVVQKRYGRAVAGAALTAPVGHVSEPTRGRSGFHLLRVVAREDPRPQSFEDVREQLETSLRAQRRRLAVMEWTQELRRSAQVEVSPTSTAVLMDAARP